MVTYMRDLITHPPWRTSGPLSGTGVTADNRLELVLLHLTVAAVVLPLLYRGAAAREPDQGEPR
jgi:hypothetical protein